MKRFFDGFGQVLYLTDQVVVLGARACDAHNIDFLKRVVSDQLGGYLTGQNDHRNGIHIRVGNAGYGVCRAGSGSDQAYPHFSTRSCIAVGGMDGRLFVPDRNMMDIRFYQFMIDIHNRSPLIPEYGIHPFILKNS